MQILTPTKEVEQRDEVPCCDPQQRPYPTDRSTLLVRVSWGLWVIPDGELLGHDGPLLDLGFEVSPWAGALNFVFPNLKHSVFTDLYHSISSPVQVRLF